MLSVYVCYFPGHPPFLPPPGSVWLRAAGHRNPTRDGVVVVRGATTGRGGATVYTIHVCYPEDAVALAAEGGGDGRRLSTGTVGGGRL